MSNETIIKEIKCGEDTYKVEINISIEKVEEPIEPSNEYAMKISMKEK